MNNLRGWLWHCEEIARDEILPWNTLLCQLMHDHNLDQSIMVDAPMLLFWALSLQQGHHPLNIPAHEKWYVHHPYLCEMHQQTDMVRIQT